VELVGADVVVGNRTRLEDDPTQHDVATQDMLCARRDYSADRLDNKGNDILQMSTICCEKKCHGMPVGYYSRMKETRPCLCVC